MNSVLGPRGRVGSGGRAGDEVVAVAQRFYGGRPAGHRLARGRQPRHPAQPLFQAPVGRDQPDLLQGAFKPPKGPVDPLVDPHT